jgi:hypothetical protein
LPLEGVQYRLVPANEYRAVVTSVMYPHGVTLLLFFLVVVVVDYVIEKI